MSDAAEKLVGRTQVTAEEAVGRTVEAVLWHEFYSDANLTILFTDNTYMYLTGGESSCGPYLLDDQKPEEQP
jgi:hypothetical protein